MENTHKRHHLSTIVKQCLRRIGQLRVSSSDPSHAIPRHYQDDDDGCYDCQRSLDRLRISQGRRATLSAQHIYICIRRPNYTYDGYIYIYVLSSSSERDQ
jgi:hypothetical protein